MKEQIKLDDLELVIGGAINPVIHDLKEEAVKKQCPYCHQLFDETEYDAHIAVCPKKN